MALNNYVALRYSAKQMSFLHCFYGIGVSVSPYILSLVIHAENGWRNGYRIAFLIQTAICALLLLSLPVWRKAGPGEHAPENATTHFTVRSTLRLRGVKSMCALFFLTCTIECSCSAWGSTYLVEYKHRTTEQAAGIILFYFIGMAVGRFLSGILAGKMHSWRIVLIGEGVLGIAMLLLAVPGPALLSPVGFFTVGLGNGPLFPNFNYLAPESFGKEAAVSVISLQMAAAYAGILLGPLLCGILGQNLGMSVFPIYILCAFLVMVSLTVLTQRKLRRRSDR